MTLNLTLHLYVKVITSTSRSFAQNVLVFHALLQIEPYFCIHLLQIQRAPSLDVGNTLVDHVPGLTSNMAAMMAILVFLVNMKTFEAPEDSLQIE